MYRRIFWAVLVTVAITGAPAFAAKTVRDAGDWANVRGLKAGVALRIATKRGGPVWGNFERASDADIEVIRWDGGGEQIVPRDDVQRITRVVGEGLSHDQVRKNLLIGAAFGAVAGAAVGGSRDVRQGTNYKWAVAAPAGAVLGIVAAGAVTIASITVQSLRLRGKKTVYASR